MTGRDTKAAHGNGSQAEFGIGDLVRHRLFGYRGVVFDADPEFGLSDDWYEQMARSRPPKDKPWYHVLPDGAEHTTYVAERNLEPDPAHAPVSHPLLGEYFAELGPDGYRPARKRN